MQLAHVHDEVVRVGGAALQVEVRCRVLRVRLLRQLQKTKRTLVVVSLKLKRFGLCSAFGTVPGLGLTSIRVRLHGVVSEDHLLWRRDILD